MKTTKKQTAGKTAQVKQAELEFVDGQPTKESMLKVIPSLLEKLDQNELNNIYGTVWNITAVKLLNRLNKQKVEELKRELAQVKKEAN